ncbi:hypothetical protein DIPPA_35548 [Diplonema papillatum]|nr:hypothetical protein DIPPA_35548 [Diplonema papillatum]
MLFSFPLRSGRPPSGSVFKGGTVTATTSAPPDIALSYILDSCAKISPAELSNARSLVPPSTTTTSHGPPSFARALSNSRASCGTVYPGYPVETDWIPFLPSTYSQYGALSHPPAIQPLVRLSP